jgi:HEAT repeat protein
VGVLRSGFGALIPALEDPSVRVREAAAGVLGEVGPEEGVVPALIQALGDKVQSIRGKAAWAMREIEPEGREVIPALIRALGDETESVRVAAGEALKAITDQDFGEDANGWQPLRRRGRSSNAMKVLVGQWCA